MATQGRLGAFACLLAVLMQIPHSDPLGEQGLEREDVHGRRPAALDPGLELLVGGLAADQAGHGDGPVVVRHEPGDGAGGGGFGGVHAPKRTHQNIATQEKDASDTVFSCGVMLSVNATTTAAETIGERIKRLAHERKGQTLAQFAAEIGVSYETARKWVTGEMAPNRTRTLKIAQTLGVPAHYVTYGDALASSNVGDAPGLKVAQRLPVVGEVKGGEDGFLEELQYPVGHGDGYVEYPTSDKSAYALRVRGDSMHPRFRAGEFVVVEPSIEPQEGDDVIVLCRDGRKLLKQLNWMRDGEIQLLSVNNGYAPLTLQVDEVESVQLVAGRVRKSAFVRG